MPFHFAALQTYSILSTCIRIWMRRRSRTVAVKFDSNDVGAKAQRSAVEATLQLTLRLDSAQASLCCGDLRTMERRGDDALKATVFPLAQDINNSFQRRGTGHRLPAAAIAGICIWCYRSTNVLRLSSSIQCINELLISVASRLQKHRKWLLNTPMPHTVAIDWAILSF